MAATPLARRSIEGIDADPLFRHSLTPMLLLDDDRRCVDANEAACLFLRQPAEAVCTLTIDDLTAPELRPGLGASWSLLLQGRSAVKELPRDMRMPDGTSVAIELSVTPHVGPGRHLAIIRFPAAHAADRRAARAARPDNVLTSREREILTLVALGETGTQIATQLFLSPATVQTHVVNALLKLKAKNRAHGVALALQAEELDLEATWLGRVTRPRAQVASLRAVDRAA